MKLRVACLVLAASASGVCSAATDASVVISKFKYGNGNAQTATITESGTAIGGGYAYQAGEFEGTLNGKTLYTFCTDVYQSFGWNSASNPYTYQLYTVDETKTLWGKSPYSESSYSQVSKLFTSHYADVRDGKTSTAFQFALWEVLYETSNSPYDVSNGTFTLTGGNSGLANDVNSAKGLANEWLKTLGNVEGYVVQSLFSGDSGKPQNKQDFLVATPVPEPQAYALALVSLGIVAGYARRRRPKA